MILSRWLGQLVKPVLSLPLALLPPLHMKTVGRTISLKTIKHAYQTQSYERDLENVGVGNRGQTPDESVEHGDDGTGDDGWDTVNVQDDPKRAS